MTRKQQRLYSFIAKTIAEAGVSPSYDETGAAMGLPSRGNVHRYLKALAARGLITWQQGLPRSIRLVRGPVTMAAIKLLEGVISEDLDMGIAVVPVALLGNLDIAVLEATERGG